MHALKYGGKIFCERNKDEGEEKRSKKKKMRERDTCCPLFIYRMEYKIRFMLQSKVWESKSINSILLPSFYFIFNMMYEDSFNLIRWSTNN